jgi:molecular chaperone DnaK (HSP70)
VSRYVLGIDLGTMNSCVAVVRDGKAVVLSDGKDNTIPSCLAITRGKELVGRPARRQAVTDPHNTVTAVKRLIGHAYDSREVQSARTRATYPIKPSPLGDVLLAVGGLELTPIQVSARILQRIKEIAEAALGTAVDQAVISVPAHFTDVQRKATKLAAEYAGLEVLRLVNEPTAAAFAYGYRKGRDFTLAVYDLGGGTFDITVMAARGDRFEVRATDGDSYLGGEDFDHAIEQWLADEWKREHGHDLSDDSAARLLMREAAEKAKVELSQVEQTRIELPFVAQLPDGSRPSFARVLTREQLDQLVEPLVQRTLDLCRRCLDSGGIPRQAIDEVLLVGGQSRLPCVRKAVALFFGRDPRRDINPDEVVAMGAALYAYSLSADRLTQEETDLAEDQYAVAVRQTAVVTKLLSDVQLKLERSTPTPGSKGAGLRSRISALLGDLGANAGAAAVASRAAPAQGAVPGADTRLGELPTPAPAPAVAATAATAPAQPTPAAKPAAAAARPAAAAKPGPPPPAAPAKGRAAAGLSATEWEKREFSFEDEDDWIPDPTAPTPPEALTPAPSAAAARAAAKPAAAAAPKPAAGTQPTTTTKPAAAVKPAAEKTAPPSKAAARPAKAAAPEPDALPASIADIRGKLSGISDIAQDALDALAAEIAAEASNQHLAQETEQLSRQLSATLASAKQAAGAADGHLKSAAQHASARRVDLRDVTSHSLGIGSAGDLMSVLIEHNSSIPIERERVFTTNQDDQSEVEIRVYQGRAARASENQMLGSFVLQGIPPARRMQPAIAVAFRIDENGILSVSARDRSTGQAQSIRIEDPLGLQQPSSGRENAPAPQ